MKEQDKLARLANAVEYLKRAMQLYGGMMVGEAGRLQGLDFYKWKHIIAQVCANSDRLVEGEPMLPIEPTYDVDHVLGRTNSIKGIFTEK